MGLKTVRFPEDLDKRLDNLARITKRTKSYFIREALEKYIDELEDIYLAETEYEEFLKSKLESVSIEEMERHLGMED